MHAERPIAIYGAGGFGREVAWLAESVYANIRSPVACFVDDDPTAVGRRINDIEVVSLDAARTRFPEAAMVIAAGASDLRRALAERATEAGFSFATLVHPNVQMSRWVEMGAGTVICAGCIVTTNIVIGRHVQVNLDCTIGHDAILGDFATLAPGVHVSGCVTLEPGVYVGTGATIVNGTLSSPIVIGRGTVVGAGAVVTKSLPPGVTAVGVPARPR